ncbi:MAG: hypothetical protein ACK5KU_05785 [Beutenbergiaceae bacterium]
MAFDGVDYDVRVHVPETVAQSFGESEFGSWAWNVPGMPTAAGEYPPVDARDDVKFLTTVIDEVSRTGCGDPDQVFRCVPDRPTKLGGWLLVLSPSGM